MYSYNHIRCVCSSTLRYSLEINVKPYLLFHGVSKQPTNYCVIYNK